MPRIFRVSFTKIIPIIAEDREELEQALGRALDTDELDEWDWSGGEGWGYEMADPLSVQNPDLIPKRFEEPEMGVVFGEVEDIQEYKETHPEYLDAVHAEATDIARKLTVEALNLKLPFGAANDQAR